MTDTSAIGAARKRLQLALDALEAALDRRLEAERGQGVLADQVHTLDIDRSRLASQLDQAAARSRRLESANREVARRLDAAIETIRSMMEANER